MKVLSMTDRRLQDRLDGLQLIACNPNLDLARVRENLRLIRERGYDRGEDLDSKLASLLSAGSSGRRIELKRSTPFQDEPDRGTPTRAGRCQARQFDLDLDR
jgi:hypothetical protein